MNTKQIGSNIQRLRQRAGLTQAQLAEKIEKSTNHIAHIEIGSAKMSLSSLLDICNAIEATPNEILFGEYPLKSSDKNDHFHETLPYMDSADHLLLMQISDLLAQRTQNTPK